MKIIYITATLPFGVEESFALTEIQELLRRGHDVTIVPAWPRGKCFHNSANSLLSRTLCAPVLSLDILKAATAEFFHAPLLCLHLLLTLSRTKNLRGLLKNVVSFPKGLWLARVVRRLQPDHLHAYWCSAPATIAMVASACSGVSWSFSAHRHDIQENSALQAKVDHAAFARFISRDGIKAANLTQESLSKVKLLHVGIEVPTPNPKQSHSGPITGICPASFVERKGHEYLFEAIHLLKDSRIRVRVLLAGCGPLDEALRQQCAKLHLEENISFLGQVQHPELLAMYDSGAVDFAVLPSLHEGIPVSLMEAMARNVPVIGTAVGGTPELLRDRAGMLVAPGNSRELAAAIELLATRASLAHEVTSKGYKRVKQEFRLESVVQELVDYFESSISGARGTGASPEPASSRL